MYMLSSLGRTSAHSSTGVVSNSIQPMNLLSPTEVKPQDITQKPGAIQLGGRWAGAENRAVSSHADTYQRL
jgi:hypothetical protein